MKTTYKVILMALPFILLTFCDKDESVTPKPYIGTWTLTQEVYANCADPLWNSTETYNCAANVDDCYKVTFTSDGKITTVIGDGSITISGTYTESGNKLIVKIVGDTMELTYTVSGNNLTLKYNDGDCDITESYVKS